MYSHFYLGRVAHNLGKTNKINKTTIPDKFSVVHGMNGILHFLKWHPKIAF